MYLNFELNDEQKEKIKKEYERYIDKSLTPDILNVIFAKNLEQTVKQVLSELVQDKDFKNAVKRKILPIAERELSLMDAKT